jgi:hypothetical protein
MSVQEINPRQELNPTFRTWHKELKLIQDSLDWQKCFPAKVSAITIC